MIAQILDAITVIAALLSIIRIITYERKGSRYNFIASFMAWLVALLMMCIIVVVVIDGSDVPICLCAIVCLLTIYLFKVKGNISRLL